MNLNNGILDGLRRIGARVRDLTIDGGLPGAPLGFRLRGATQAGAPQTGTWKTGDQVPDRNAVIWICTRGGTGPAARWTAAGPALPFTTISPSGLSSGATVANNGASFGPDTAGTTTCGIQEALNSLPACTLYDAGGNLITGAYGALSLFAGVFQTSAAIVLPAGQITIEGCGTSGWVPGLTIPGPYAADGGSVIVSSNYLQSVMKCPVDAYNYPATVAYIRNLEMRLVSPSAVQTASAPDLFNMTGHLGGEISCVNVLEVLTAGGIGNHMYIMCNFNSGAAKDNVMLRNIRGYGGHTGVKISQSHVHAVNISGGFTSSAIDANDCGIDIQNNLDNYFANLHGYSTHHGLSYLPYYNLPWSTQVIHGFHFEAVNHYINTDSTSVTGTLVIDMPAWNNSSLLNPSTDIASVLSGRSSSPSLASQTGLAVITHNELDPNNIGPGIHVTVPAASWTAGTSPYTFSELPYDCNFVLTTVGGMTALTLDGQAIFGGSFSVGQLVFVSAGHSLVATWAGTAPVFEVLPQ